VGTDEKGSYIVVATTIRERKMPRPNRRRLATNTVLVALRAADASHSDLVEATGLHPRSLDRLITDLRAQGYRILSIRDGRTYYYRLDSEPGDQP
jgi:DNA-binding transcriptional ArsR family regulator